MLLSLIVPGFGIVRAGLLRRGAAWFLASQLYAGDFRIFVDWAVIDEVVRCHRNPPAGFAIDFGVTRAGRTLIVEQNDGFSLGAYGLDQITYAKLLEARWNEIVAPA